MYPKSTSHRTHVTPDKRREQLGEMLINKMRNKHKVNTLREPEIDMLIKLEVSRFVMPSQGQTSLQAKDINEIDRKIAKRVADIRGTQTETAQVVSEKP